MTIKNVALCRADGTIYNIAVFPEDATQEQISIHFEQPTDFGVEYTDADLCGIGGHYSVESDTFSLPEEEVE